MGRGRKGSDNHSMKKDQCAPQIETAKVEANQRNVLHYIHRCVDLK